MKTKPTHTKGPYSVKRSDKLPDTARIINAKGEGVGLVTNDAHADLFAAAPELLEALTNCVAWIEMALKHSKPDHANLVQAKAAISKAKGGAV
jgi:hypothetical protein